MSIFDSIGDIVHDIGNFANSVVNKVATTVDPHLAHLEQEYSSLSQQYNQLRIQLTETDQQFQSTLNTYRSMAACNATLLIAGKVFTWSDTEFNKFLTSTQAPPKVDKRNVLPASVSDLISSTCGGNNIVNLLFSPGLAAEFGIQAVTASLGFGAFGSTVSTAISTALTFGIGSAFGPLGSLIGAIVSGETEYAKANDKIENAIHTINSNLQIITTAINQLAEGIQNERMQYLQVMPQLNRIQEAHFRWRLTSDDANSTYISAMSSAVQQYGIVFRLRSDWQRLKANAPSTTYQKYVLNELLFAQQKPYSKAQIQQFIALLASRPGSLRDAFLAAGSPGAIS